MLRRCCATPSSKRTRMKPARDLISCALLFVGFASCVNAQQSSTPYRLSSAANGALTVERGGKRAVYQPTFTVIRSEADPQLRLSGFASTPGESLEGVNVENYPLPRWRAANGNGMTDVLYEAGSAVEVRASSARPLTDGGVAWTFEPTAHFTIEAEVHPVANEPPRISWKFTARTPAWYTVGYTGAPAVDPATADGLLQPLIWQEKRFPRAPLLSAESMGGLPLTLVTRASTLR